MCPICKSKEVKTIFITHSYYLREIKAGTEVFKQCKCGYGWFLDASSSLATANPGRPSGSRVQ